MVASHSVINNKAISLIFEHSRFYLAARFDQRRFYHEMNSPDQRQSKPEQQGQYPNAVIQPGDNFIRSGRGGEAGRGRLVYKICHGQCQKAAPRTNIIINTAATIILPSITSSLTSWLVWFSCSSFAWLFACIWRVDRVMGVGLTHWKREPCDWAFELRQRGRVVSGPDPRRYCRVTHCNLCEKELCTLKRELCFNRTFEF